MTADNFRYGTNLEISDVRKLRHYVVGRHAWACATPSAALRRGFRPAILDAYLQFDMYTKDLGAALLQVGKLG